MWIALVCSVLALTQAEAPSKAPLTLGEALAVGRAHAPTLEMAEANAQAAFARVGEARAPLLPQLSGQAEYERTTSNYVLRPGSLPSSLTPQSTRSTNKTYNFWVFQATLNQLVYDFGASLGNLHNAQALAQAQEQNARASAIGLDYNVRTAYFAAWAAQAMVEVGEQTVVNMNQHLLQAKHAVRAGTQADIDLYTSQSNLAAAQVTLVNYENAFASSKIALSQTMGVEQDVDYTLAAPEVPQAQHNDDEATLLQEALANRPELLQMAAQIGAQNAKVKSYIGQRFPSLSAQATISEQGQKLNKLAYNWAVLGILSWNASTGGLLTNEIHEARATLRAVKASERQFRLMIRSAVQNARLSVRAGRKALEAARVAATAANERLRQAERRYATGVGNIIELSDAQVSATSAAAQVVQSENQWWTAQAQLVWALGRRE